MFGLVHFYFVYFCVTLCKVSTFVNVGILFIPTYTERSREVFLVVNRHCLVTKKAEKLSQSEEVFFLKSSR